MNTPKHEADDDMHLDSLQKKLLIAFFIAVLIANIFIFFSVANSHYRAEYRKSQEKLEEPKPQS